MGVARRSNDLSPLFRNCLFRSDERVDSHSHVARELSDHSLKWRRGTVDSAMFKGELNQLRLYLLRYGAEVEVTPRPFEDFALVHMSLRGGSEIEVDGERLNVAEGRAAVIAPRRKVHLHWFPGTDQLILKVPHAMIRDLQGKGDGDDLALAPGFLVPRMLAPQWDLLMQCLLNIMAVPKDSTLTASWVDHFERNIAKFLVEHQPATVLQKSPAARIAAAVEGDDRSLSHADGARRMEAVREYMQSRLSAPISLSDLARAGKVSVRTLNQLSHRHHGATPMELLRNMRLDAVRSRLVLQPDANVTDVALDFGFGHLGRFAAYYHERFHELPRDTQRGHRG